MRKLVFATLIAMLFVAFSAKAQDYEVQPPREDKVVVGAIGGTVDVTALGGASYTIPIQVPEGIGGMQPSLSVVYNSQSGNGLLGWGWTLGGLSAITRVGQTDYHDGRVTGVSFDYHDRFALDGQRLMVLDGATYGSNGAEYRTEVDGMSKIVSYTETVHVSDGGLLNHGSYSYKIISHFKVFTADGKILYYGKVANEPDNARVIYESEGKKTVVMWLLKRVEDRMGNYMVYNYEIGNNEYRLNNIQYCANSHVRVASATERSTKYGIDFHYKKDRVDKESMAIGNYFLYQPWLLERISIYHWSQPLSSYRFVYDNNSGLLNTHNYYNRLMEIHYDYEGISYHPTMIEWGEFPDPSNVLYNTNDMYISSISYQAPEPLTLEGRVKFAGDFNGDGLQDLIVVGEYNGYWYKVDAFMNKGHTKTDDSSGNLRFEKIGSFYIPYHLRWVYVRDFDGDGIDEVLFVGHSAIGHGGRCLATYDIFKLCPINRETVENNPQPRKDTRYAAAFVPLENSNLTFEIFGEGSDYIWHNGNVFEFNITNKKDYSFIVGDFLGKGHCDIIFTYPNKPYVYISYQGGLFVESASVTDWNALKYVPGDFDGDGKMEVWFDNEFDDDPGVIAKVYINSDGRFSWYPVAYMMDHWNRNYVGDFNGDGHTDFLTFRKDSKTWQIVLFKQDWHSYPVFDVTEIMRGYLGEEDPNDANFSIEGKKDLDFFLEVADVDGDGKSDIMLRNKKSSTKGNYKFAVLYGPPVGQGFSRVEEFDASILLGNESASGLCVGNFLGQENISLLSNRELFSFPQHSIYYNVKSVTDGMGNQVAFDYGYLVNNPMKSDNIYEVDRIGQNRAFDLYSVPLPTKSVRTLTTSNVNVPAQAHAVDSFSYANLIVHRKGKGILGFVGITRDSWQVDCLDQDNPEAKYQSKLVRSFTYKPMEEHRALVPESEELYRYRDDGEEVKTASTAYHYCKGLCQRDMNSIGIKVFAPLAKTTVADEYELLGERGHLRRRITENDYEGQQPYSPYAYYSQAIRLTETRQGTDAETPGAVSQCEFQTTTHTEYASMLNTENLWMPNRPLSVLTESSRRTQGYANLKSLTTYSYDPDKPYLPKYVTTYPSGEENSNDSLAMTAHYTYHPTGRLKAESRYPVAGRSEDGFKTIYEYTPDNRFLKKKTEEYDPTHTNDYVTSYEYDAVYGNRKTETDCNGYSTCYENPDHLGLTVRSYKRDKDANHTRIAGTETVTALRWLGGSAYQSHGEGLSSPYYFTWKRSSGGAEALTIYDALGRELRTVSHGLPENGSSKIVYKDTQYDNWGRLHKVSEPYFKGLPLEQRKWTTYTYGDFDRIDTLYNQQYTVEGQTIQPYTRYEYDGLTTTTTSGIVDGDETHVTATTLNIMGWTESNSEVIDGNGTENTTTYGHNADGSLAWSMVNNNEATKISVLYDDAGNRKELTDPNYGTVTDHYNAFGQLDYTISPKGDVTAYEYDNLGRMKTRTETCHSNPGEPERLTTWNYSETPGKKGLLDGIELKEGENVIQSIAYDYEQYNRLASKTETILGTPYTTSYAYDDEIGFPLRLKATTYPTGYTMTRDYDALTGRLRQLKHGSTVLWTTESMNALGQITRYTTGNGAVTDIAYDDRHLLKRQVTRGANQNNLQDFGYSYDIFANLAARTDNLRNLEETFTYDHLNRLTDVWLNNVHTGHMAYDALGRMTDKRTDGQNVFSAAQHDYVGPDGQLRPHAISSATVEDNPFPTDQLDMEYTMFDKVKRISTHQHKSFGYDYGYDHLRIRQVSSQIMSTRIKTYIGNSERIDEASKSPVYRTYLSGPMGVFAVAEMKDGAGSVHYVLKDHLGSWTTITDANGNIEQEVSFDAWGNPRDAETWSGSYSGALMFDRGFTGHEHVYYNSDNFNTSWFDIGLINMNGRMYDPVMSSFLSVDNYVQAPDFSQSFNRYAYCLNNPLKYTDPTGEKWWHWALADVLSGGFLSSSALVTAELAFTTVATTGLTAYSMHFPNSEAGYELQKMFSPIAIKFSYGFGSTNHIGVDVSLGMSGAPAYRWHCGASYYFGNNVYGNYNGWETRTGAEFRVLPLVAISGTKFKAGEFSQTTNRITLGDAFTNISYENDYMFDIHVLGHYNADNGDEYRTAAARIKFGSISVGVNLFTGNPGLKGGEDGVRKTFEDPEFGGRETYVLNELGDDPDKYRAGVLYVGIGPFRFGRNSEQIRHTYQNRFAHDFLMGGDSPYFKVLDIKPSWYFYYGVGTGNTLW